jgi:hypothetical protein
MCCLGCSIKFCSTEYNTPRSFLLAGYSDVFCDLCAASHDVTHQPLILHASPWERPLGPTHYPFSYQLASWFCSEVSTTCYFSCTLVPLRASRCTFFPLHLLHCYNHRSYQWSHPRGCEQACLNGPLLAMLCRHRIFGYLTALILRRRQAAYRRLDSPESLYNWTLRRSRTCQHGHLDQAVSATSAGAFSL